MEKYLVINAGSSSLKAQLIDSQTSKVYAKCTCERIGLDGSFIKFESDKGKTKLDYVMREHSDAIKGLIELLLGEEYGCIKNMSEIDAIGHRMVHGGEKFVKPVVLDENTLKAFEEIIELGISNGFTPWILHSLYSLSIADKLPWSVIPTESHL